MSNWNYKLRKLIKQEKERKIWFNSMIKRHLAYERKEMEKRKNGNN